MYAIVDIAGQQFKVEKEQKLFVHRLPGDAESKVNFDSVLLIDNDGKITLGTPVIDGASVSAKILSHVKGDKVLVFKKKRRKGYKTLNGHRQLFTEIQIEKIDEKGGKKASAKTEDKPAAEAKADVSTVAKAKVETKAPAEKKAAKPKAEAKKKPAAKKPAAKKTTKKAPKK
ncbi:MAG: 50S ribosomal protein L21 [Flavobacteriales bacterium]|nr:50S ribosomal protein L21 [Flavobacteriales bacterium]